MHTAARSWRRLMSVLALTALCAFCTACSSSRKAGAPPLDDDDFDASFPTFDARVPGPVTKCINGPTTFEATTSTSPKQVRVTNPAGVYACVATTFLPVPPVGTVKLGTYVTYDGFTKTWIFSVPPEVTTGKYTVGFYKDVQGPGGCEGEEPGGVKVGECNLDF